MEGKISLKKIIIYVIIFVLVDSIIVGTFLITNRLTNKENQSIDSKYSKNDIVIEDTTSIAVKTIPNHYFEKLIQDKIPVWKENAQETIRQIYFSDEKKAYLTFDDGPSELTPQILDILKEEGVLATFFTLGSRIELHPDILKREYNEGHYIANHGYSHVYSKIYASPQSVIDEYLACENSIKNALGNADYNSYLFRFPGGSSGGKYESIKSQAKPLLTENGIAFTNWNCLNGDAEGVGRTEEELISRFEQTKGSQGSLIVLMHDASDKQTTVNSLRQIITNLKQEGYSFHNFYEIFNEE